MLSVGKSYTELRTGGSLDWWQLTIVLKNGFITKLVTDFDSILEIATVLSRGDVEVRVHGLRISGSGPIIDAWFEVQAKEVIAVDVEHQPLNIFCLEC